MVMVSDQEIASCLDSVLDSVLLRQSPSDPSGGVTAVNINGVVQQVQAKLGLDLSHKAAFIRDHINLRLRPPPAPAPAPATAKDHFALQQQQFLLNSHHPQLPYQLLRPQQQQQHQIPASAFTHISQQHQQHQHQQQQQQQLQQQQQQQQELAFRCAPPAAPMQQHPQPHHPQPQHPHLQQQQHQAAAMAAAVMVKQEGQFAPGSTVPAPAKASAAPTKKRGGPGGLNKVCGVSPELQTIVGEPAMPRTQIVKQLWAYIRKNNLQDPNNKRKIICNDELRLVFETDCTDMFKMNKLLAKHIIPLDPTKGPGPNAKKLKVEEVTSATETEASESPVVISDALSKFFGNGERAMLQSEALKRIWDYIKANQLEDPVNSMTVLCDAKLQQLFGCESLSALGVSEMLARHVFQQS